MPIIPSELPKQRVVAFLDVLGMRQLVADIFSHADLPLYQGLLKALHIIFGHAELANRGKRPVTAARATAFSDSIVLSDEFSPLGASSVIARVGLLSSRLMKLGVFCRGGIAAGPTYHDESILFGPGLIEAYELEHDAALYPRVVLSDAIVELVSEWLYKRLQPGSDGFWSVDPFYQMQVAATNELLAVNVSPYDPRWEPDDFAAARGHIMEALRKAKKGKNLSLLSKYRWLAAEFNDAARRYVPNQLQEIPWELIRYHGS